MKITSFLWTAVLGAHVLSLPLTARAGDDTASKETGPVATEKAPPLPIHTIEGVGGLVITPIAYLVNPGPEGTIFGLPSMSTTYVKAGRKNLEAAAITETLFGRVELGYSASRMGIGSLVDDVKQVTNIWIPDYVVLHNVNLRVLALAENSFDLPLPALSLGATYKYNDGISDVNQKLGGLLNTIGYRGNEGVDLTVTTSKTFTETFWHPLLVTAGVRFSEAEQLGYFGFGNKYRATFEGNIAYCIVDWLWLAAEFRGNANAYHQIANPYGGNLVGPVDNWWAVGVTALLSRHATVTVGWGHLGSLLNTTENKCLGVQAKYEF